MTLDDELSNTTRMRFQSSGHKKDDEQSRKVNKSKKQKSAEEDDASMGI